MRRGDDQKGGGGKGANGKGKERKNREGVVMKILREREKDENRGDTERRVKGEKSERRREEREGKGKVRGWKGRLQCGLTSDESNRSLMPFRPSRYP